ncbi:hypothetical protein CR513_20813, partial [Mucuna pruriens]
MHVEKNVFDNIFNTIMDKKGKTKDNENVREDMKMICKRRTLKLKAENDKYKKPKATYITVCEWIKQLKFSDGYVSNIARCINIDDGKIYGMKSHDYHVFMQRLIPLVFRYMLPKLVWGALTKLSIFFKEVCATELCASVMENLEKIFPPTFFDVMEHLVMHLPYEVKVAKPMQYKWIYPFERCMLYVKRKVQNKARVEGSICEAYILEEISNFASMHDMINKCLSIFKYPCRPIGNGSNRFLIDMELQIAETYVLVNYKEIEPFL